MKKILFKAKRRIVVAVLAAAAAIIAVAAAICGLVGGGNFSVFADDTTHTSHSYTNGFCTCGDYEEPSTNSQGNYLIDNAGKLYWYAAQINSGTTSISAKLTADIVVNENVLVGGALNTDTTALSGFRVWTPIGFSNGTNDYKYNGTFYGDGHTISGLYFKERDPQSGLFGNVGSSGCVQDVGVIGSYVYGYWYNGVIAGYNHGKIISCYSESIIRGSLYTGGIVGYNYGTVEYCYNTGAVISSGAERIGGVVGYNSSGATVTGCYNTAAVTGGSYVGGVAGENDGTVTDCYNTGSVTTSDATDYRLTGRNYGTATNSYFLDSADGADLATTYGGTNKTDVQFKSGEIAYLLNGEKTDGTQAYYLRRIPIQLAGVIY